MPHSNLQNSLEESIDPNRETSKENRREVLISECGSQTFKSPTSLKRQFHLRTRLHRQEMKNGRGGWCVRASSIARNTYNPIRSIVENLRLSPHPDKHMIALSIGDPTIFGNLKPPQEAVEAVCASIQSMNFNGYAPSVGYQEAREAVAKYVSTPDTEVTAKVMNALSTKYQRGIGPQYETLLYMLDENI